MPKYWGKHIFAHGRFPEVGQKQKMEREKRKKEIRANKGNNNVQLRIATPPRMAHAKPPGPIIRHPTESYGLLFVSICTYQ